MRALAVTVLLGAGLGLVGCGHSQPAAPVAAAASSLPVQAVERSNLPAEALFDGTLEAVDQAIISAQTAGRVVEVPVDVDDTVTQGQVLVRFRDVEPRAHRDAAAAEVRQAEAAEQQAAAEYQRIKSVYDKHLIAQARMDRVTASYQAAQARLSAARAALSGAAEQQDYAVVRAPYNGIIVGRRIQPGEAAAPGQPLLTLLALDHQRAVVDIPESLVGPIRAQHQARVLLPGGDSIAATEVRVFPYADAQTHTFRVRVSLPKLPAGLYPGMAVRVAFATGEQSAIAVPASAVVQRGELSGVYLRDAQGQLQLRAVRVGRPLADGRVVVLSGLDAGEQLVTDPQAAAAQLAAPHS